MNLVYDTIPRRTRSAVANSIHAADKFVSRLSRRRRRVLFEAASPLSLVVFRPVLTRLQEDARLEFWFTTADQSWDANHTFLPAGISDRIVTPRQARWMKFDAYINTDFWNTTWLGRRTMRFHLFHGVAGKYGLDAPLHIAPVVRSFDRILFANDDRLRKYVDAGLLENEGPRGQLIGYPKCDCLVDGSLDRRHIQDTLGLDPSRPTILYAPTWSTFSSLNSIGSDLLSWLGRLDVNVIVKLHDRSFDKRSQREDSIDWSKQLESLCRSWRVLRAQDADISPYLFVSDLLVTDHSSAGFEFMLLDRPLVVIDCPELLRKARVAPDKVRLLQDAASVAKCEITSIVHAVERALADPSAGSSMRRAAAAGMFYRPGTATSRAVNCVYEALELDPLEVEPTSAERLPASVLSCSRSAHHV